MTDSPILLVTPAKHNVCLGAAYVANEQPTHRVHKIAQRLPKMVVKNAPLTMVLAVRYGCSCVGELPGLLRGSFGRFESSNAADSGRQRMKILVVITEDWFALSHFVPLLAELQTLAKDVVVVTRSSGRLQEIDKLGVRTRAFDMRRGSLNVAALVHVRDGLARIIDEERPDVVHAIAMQTMVMTSLALTKAAHRPSAVIMHLTGLGYLGHSRSPVAYALRPLARAAIRRSMANYNTWLLAENTDDVSRMIAERVAAPGRTAVVPGAGINPELFPEMAPPLNAVPRVAFVGRMLLSKGLDVLMKAHRQLRARGIKMDLALYGAADSGSRQAIAQNTLLSWSGETGVKWHGRTDDIVGVWRTADMAVVPALGGEGMPRAMLEAGACGRPLVVSDIPGCRQFVRHGVEGFLVPPGDPDALAQELGRLASDPILRLQIGAAARRRVLQHYTEHVVKARIRRVYQEATAPAGQPIAVGDELAAQAALR